MSECRGVGCTGVGRIVVAMLLCLSVGLAGTAASADAKRLTKSQRAKVRAELRKQVKRHPGIVRRTSFLRRAALVNFKLPVTIRLRNPCSEEAGQNPRPTFGGAPPQMALGQNCMTQGTALNQRSIPTASVNLGPSLGTRQVALGGGLAAVVEFSDTYDGGALGNVNIKLLPGNKTLSSSSVPLLWNRDITGTGARSDANAARSLGRPGGLLASSAAWTDPLLQGCRDWMAGAGDTGGIAPATYNAFLYGAPTDLGFGVGSGMPGYPVYTPGGAPSGVYLPVYPGVDDPGRILAGGVVGGNDWIGPNPNPFPTGFAPGGAVSNAADTVLRTNALSLGVAPGGVSVNMSTGTATTPGGLTTAQGSQDVTLGYSGGQANLFGNIPGKNVGIDVTVNLQTRITGIARIMDQDIFKEPMLIEGEDFPAGYFNCRQVFTGAVQNYIPGVRLTGSLRIAPAITKDGRVRIAKATVASDVNNPDRVALSACLFPSKPYNEYAAGSSDSAAAKVPTLGQVNAGGAFFGPPAARLAADGNTSLPERAAARYPNLTEGIAPTSIPCGTDSSPELADIIRKAGLTGTVSGMPTPTDPAYAGVGYRGDQASVAGDITVHPIEVDVLLGDVSTGAPLANPSALPEPVPPETYITSAPAGTTPSTAATILFTSLTAGATYECRLDGGPWSVCTSPEGLAGLANGAHTFQVRAKDPAGVYDPSPAQATWTVNTSYSGPLSWTSNPPPGGTFTNNPGGGPPGPTMPTVSLTSPNGGSVTATSSGPGPPPVGYGFLGQGLVISAPAATPGSPLSITLSLDVSGNPLILTPNDVVIFRNNVPVPDCSPNTGQATPDPCVAARSLSLGIATITVRTSAASTWNVGEGGPDPAPGPAPPPDAASSLRPYDAASPWNTPISPSASVDPQSSTFINAIADNGLPLTSDPDQFAIALYPVNANTPRTSVSISNYFSSYDSGDSTRVGSGFGSTITGVPIPPGATAGEGDDGQVVFWDPATGVEWSFWQLKRNANGTYTATNGSRYHTTSGYFGRFADGLSGRGAGTPYFAGLVRPWEIQQGRIDHALAFAMDSPSSGCRYPASKSDGEGVTGVDPPEGARLQLNPSLGEADFNAMGLSPMAKTIARALQQYGMYVVDNSGSSKIYLEDRATAGWDGTVTRTMVSSIPWSAFRVVQAPPVVAGSPLLTSCNG